ncbi:recombinase RecT [Sutcliffiella cohnii]
MSKNQLAVYQSLVFGELTEQDVITIRETIGKDCNESQFKLFMAIAKSSGANPVANEIYPAVRGGQLTVQFGVDFYVRKSKESEGYRGYDVQLVHENDEFQMHQEQAKDGRYYAVIDKHSWGFPRGRVIGGYAIAYREGFAPFSVVMEVDEVEHFKKSNIGMQKTMWTNYFNDMFKKHMTRRALKGAFDLNFDDDQAPTNEVDPYEPRQRVDITPDTKQIVTGEDTVIDPEEELTKLWAEIQKKTEAKGVSKQDLKDYIQEKYKKGAKELTLQQVVGLNKMIDFDFPSKKESEPMSFDDFEEMKLD